MFSVVKSTTRWHSMKVFKKRLTEDLPLSKYFFSQRVVEVDNWNSLPAHIRQGSRSDQGFADKSVKKISGGENNHKKYCNMSFMSCNHVSLTIFEKKVDFRSFLAQNGCFWVTKFFTYSCEKILASRISANIALFCLSLVLDSILFQMKKFLLE